MKPKAAIVYLAPTQKMQRFEVLLYSLELLEKHCNHQYSYPIVIFHEDLEEKQMEKIRSTSSSTVSFALLENFQKLPTEIDKKQLQRWVRGEDGARMAQRRVGYRQMCRFYSYELFIHPALKSYDYYWRFDDDSFLIRPLNFDPFQKMYDHGYIYGYRSLMREDPEGQEGVGLKELFALTKKFARQHKLSLKYIRPFSDWLRRSNGKQYYTNFEITNIDFWRKHVLYREYITQIEQSQGFFKFRWGDSIIRTLASVLFLKPQEIHHFGTLPYRHNYHYALENSPNIYYKPPVGFDKGSIKDYLGAYQLEEDATIFQSQT